MDTQKIYIKSFFNRLTFQLIFQVIIILKVNLGIFLAFLYNDNPYDLYLEITDEKKFDSYLLYVSILTIQMIIIPILQRKIIFIVTDLDYLAMTTTSIVISILLDNYYS